MRGRGCGGRGDVRLALRRLRGAVSTMGACPGPNGHRSITGDELVRRWVSALTEDAARGRAGVR